MISPDVQWYAHASTNEKTIYRTNPLLVKHVPGWSNTWKQERHAILEGGPKHQMWCETMKSLLRVINNVDKYYIVHKKALLAITRRNDCMLDLNLSVNIVRSDSIGWVKALRKEINKRWSIKDRLKVLKYGREYDAPNLHDGSPNQDTWFKGDANPSKTWHLRHKTSFRLMVVGKDGRMCDQHRIDFNSIHKLIPRERCKLGNQKTWCPTRRSAKNILAQEFGPTYTKIKSDASNARLRWKNTAEVFENAPLAYFQNCRISDR